MTQPISGQFKKLEEKVGPLLNDVKEQGEAAFESAGEIAGDVWNQVSDVPKLVKKYPMQSMLIGFGAGILGGILISRLND